MNTLLKSLLACGIAAGISSSVSAITLSIDPSSQAIGVGGTATYNIVVSDLGSAKLGAFDAEVDFNSIIAQAIAASSSTGWGNDFTDLSIAGEVYIADVANAGVFLTGPGNFALATFTLKGLADGTTLLEFNPGATSLSVDNGITTISADFTAVGGSLHVPDAGNVGSLLSLGLLSLGFVRTRFSK